MSGAEKAEVLTKVASSSVPKRKVLGELGVPRSTYCRWLRRKEQQGLEDDVGGANPPWNKLTSKEVDSVLSRAREMPELSPRQLAAWTTDSRLVGIAQRNRRDRLVSQERSSDNGGCTALAPAGGVWCARPQQIWKSLQP